MVAAGSTPIQAAASSMASGRPSRRRQIAATVAAFSGVRANPASAASARSANSRTAAVVSDDPLSVGSGRASGGTATACSP